MERSAVIERLEVLADPWWGESLIEEHYGGLPSKELRGRFRVWARNRLRPIEVERPGKIDRYAFETYLQSAKLVPVKWAAATLGMTDSSLLNVLGEIANRGMNPRGALGDDQLTNEDRLVDEVVLRDFRKLFPALQYTYIADHNERCRVYHEVIKDDLDIDVEPLWCITSQAMGEEPRWYAHEYDAITLEPVGLRWQVWLDVGKPINLYPDVCATKTFIEHRDLLESRLFGDQSPEVPEQLVQAR